MRAYLACTTSGRLWVGMICLALAAGYATDAISAAPPNLSAGSSASQPPPLPSGPGGPAVGASVTDQDRGALGFSNHPQMVPAPGFSQAVPPQTMMRPPVLQPPWIQPPTIGPPAADAIPAPEPARSPSPSSPARRTVPRKAQRPQVQVLETRPKPQPEEPWSAQGPAPIAEDEGDEPLPPLTESDAKIRTLIREVMDPEIPLDVDPQRSKLIRTRRAVTRVSITNPDVVQVVQFSPTEFELIGGESGRTTMSLWFGDGSDAEVLRYLVRVGPDLEEDDRRRFVYGELEKRINELFPNSEVQLIPVGTTLMVRGQARDGEEAGRILSMISGTQVNQLGEELGPGAYADVGTSERPFLGVEDLPASNIVNMLEVPGEQQIMLKVRVAEISRSANRAIGTRLRAQVGDFTWNSLFGIPGAFSAVLDTEELSLAISAVSSNSYSKILAEPNLVTLNGRPAFFNAGGAFAVPTAVGVGGIGAVSTSFQSFGTQISFIPTVIDKDRIRMQVFPSVTAVNSGLTVGGIPGINGRSVATTVDLREGQWMAIAGLLEDNQSGSKDRVPLLGDIPILDTLFGRREVGRSESELIILVSPEFVHPLEAEEVPLILPGMDVNEPGDWDLYVMGRYEGHADCHHRSTVWPIHRDHIYRNMMRAHHQALGGGQDTKSHANYQASEAYYIQGEHGFSN